MRFEKLKNVHKIMISVVRNSLGMYDILGYKNEGRSGKRTSRKFISYLETVHENGDMSNITKGSTVSFQISSF